MVCRHRRRAHAAQTLIALAITLMACTEPPPPQSQRNELRDYLERSQRVWAGREAAAARGISRLFRSHFVDPQLARQVVEDLGPLSGRHLSEIRQVRPLNPRLAAIHGRYEQTWEGLARGVQTLARAMPAEDGPGLAEARGLMEQWRKGMIAVARDLRELMNELAVTMPEGEDQAEAPRGVPARSRTTAQPIAPVSLRRAMSSHV